MLGPSGDGLGHSSPLEARPVPAWRQPTCASAPACMRPGVSWDKCCWFSRDLEWNEGQAKFVALETMSRTQVGQGLLGFSEGLAGLQRAVGTPVLSVGCAH